MTYRNYDVSKKLQRHNESGILWNWFLQTCMVIVEWYIPQSLCSSVFGLQRKKKKIISFKLALGQAMGMKCQ